MISPLQALAPDATRQAVSLGVMRGALVPVGSKRATPAGVLAACAKAFVELQAAVRANDANAFARSLHSETRLALEEAGGASGLAELLRTCREEGVDTFVLGRHAYQDDEIVGPLVFAAVVSRGTPGRIQGVAFREDGNTWRPAMLG